MMINLLTNLPPEGKILHVLHNTVCLSQTKVSVPVRVYDVRQMVLNIQSTVKVEKSFKLRYFIKCSNYITLLFKAAGDDSVVAKRGLPAKFTG